MMLYLLLLICSCCVEAWDTSMPGGLKIGIEGKIYSFTMDVCSGGVFFKRPVRVEFVCPHGYFFRRPNGCAMSESDVIAGRNYVCINETTSTNYDASTTGLVQAFIPLTTPELPLEHSIAFYDDADSLRNFRRYSFLEGMRHMYDPHDPGSPGVVVCNSHNTPEINIGSLCYQGIPATDGAAFVANITLDFSEEPDGFFTRPCQKTSAYFPWRKTLRYDFTEGFSELRRFAREIWAYPGGEPPTESTTSAETTEVPTTPAAIMEKDAETYLDLLPVDEEREDIDAGFLELLPPNEEVAKKDAGIFPDLLPISADEEKIEEETGKFVDILPTDEDVTTTQTPRYDSNEDSTYVPMETIEETADGTYEDLSWQGTTIKSMKVLASSSEEGEDDPENTPLDESLKKSKQMENLSEKHSTRNISDEHLTVPGERQKPLGTFKEDKPKITQQKQTSVINEVSASINRSDLEEIRRDKADLEFLNKIMKQISEDPTSKKEYGELVSNFTDYESKVNPELYIYSLPNTNQTTYIDFEVPQDMDAENATTFPHTDISMRPENNPGWTMDSTTSQILESGESVSSPESTVSENGSSTISTEETMQLTTTTTSDGVLSTTESVPSSTANIIDSSSEETHENVSQHNLQAKINDIYRHSPIQLKTGIILSPDLTNWDPYIEEAVFLAKNLIRKDIMPPGCKTPVETHVKAKWFDIMKAAVNITKTLTPQELIPSEFFDKVVELFGYVFRSIPDDDEGLSESEFANIISIFKECSLTTKTLQTFHVTGCPRKFSRLDVTRSDGSKVRTKLPKLPPKTSAFRSHRNDVVVESVWNLVDIALCHCYSKFLPDNLNEYYRLYSYLKHLFLHERIQKRWYVAFKGIDAYSGLLPFGDYKTLMYNFDKVKAAAHTQCRGAEWLPKPELLVPEYSLRNIFKDGTNARSMHGKRARLLNSVKLGDNPDPFIIGNEEVQLLKPFQSRANTKVGAKWRVKREAVEEGRTMLDFMQSKKDSERNGGAEAKASDENPNENASSKDVLPSTAAESGTTEPAKPGFKPADLEIWNGMAYCLQANYEDLPNGKFRMRGITPSLESLADFCNEKDLTPEIFYDKPYPNPYGNKRRKANHR